MHVGNLRDTKCKAHTRLVSFMNVVSAISRSLKPISGLSVRCERGWQRVIVNHAISNLFNVSINYRLKSTKHARLPKATSWKRKIRITQHGRAAFFFSRRRAVAFSGEWILKEEPHLPIGCIRCCSDASTSGRINRNGAMTASIQTSISRSFTRPASATKRKRMQAY